MRNIIFAGRGESTRSGWDFRYLKSCYPGEKVKGNRVGPWDQSLSWIISTPGNSCVYSKLIPWFKKIQDWSFLRHSQANLVPMGPWAIWDTLNQVQWAWNGKFVIKITYSEYFLFYEKKNCNIIFWTLLSKNMFIFDKFHQSLFLVQSFSSIH